VLRTEDWVTMMKRLAVVALAVCVWAVLFLGLFAAPASACECPSTVPTLQQNIERAAVVFSGKVVALQPHPQMPSFYVAVFAVTQAWKGVQHQQVRIETPPFCSRDFQVGETYIVYAEANDRILYAIPCGRTALLAFAGDDLKVLGKGYMPTLPGTGSSSNEGLH